MKEIGGYLEFELRFHGNEYHTDAVGLNLARNAILYLAETKDYRRIYLPYYLCDSISKKLKKLSIEFEYYHIDEFFRPVFMHSLKQQEAILIVNYYGQLSNKEIMSYKKAWDRIIVDNTQDFFSSPVAGVDTIYNARKYFGVVDGAYLYTDKPLERELEKGYSYNRLTCLAGRFEINGSTFYDEYVGMEKSLEQESLKTISAFSKNILCGIDYVNVCKTRTDNFQYLHQRLGSLNRWNFGKGRGTYMYPFWTTKGREVRRRLIMNEVYIPILWQNVLQDLTEEKAEYQMAENILPLPIDQRYTQNDMRYVADKILEILKEV